MDGLTVRPLGKGCFTPVASPDHRSLRAPLEPMTKALRPWSQTRGYRAPRPTRRRLSRPGTHDQSLRALDDAQAAFMPLHPDEGIPLDPPPDVSG